MTFLALVALAAGAPGCKDASNGACSGNIELQLGNQTAATVSLVYNSPGCTSDAAGVPVKVGLTRSEFFLQDMNLSPGQKVIVSIANQTPMITCTASARIGVDMEYARVFLKTPTILACDCGFDEYPDASLCLSDL